MKFIHAADLHLDSPFEGLQRLPKALWQQIHEAPFKATEKMVTDAIDEQVDFVLLVGDLFDRETQSVSAQVFLNEQLQRLIDAGIAVFVSFGNHDYLTADQTLSLPEGVTVFGSDVTTELLTTADHSRVAISGFSYADRWLEEDVVEKFPKRSTADFQIGMLHGAQKQGESNHYAPFTVGELAATNYDYWALGHIHKPGVLAKQPPIIYSGTIQGRHKLESGEHGYQLVSSQGQQLRRQFVAVDQVRWASLSLAVDEETTDDSLIQAVQAALLEMKTAVFQLIDLKLTGIEKLSASLLSRLNDGTWLERLDQAQKKAYRQSQAWVYEVTVQPSSQPVRYAKLDAAYWQRAQETVFTPDNVEMTAGKLMQYAFIANHLRDPKTTAKLMDQAKNDLLAQSRLEEENDADHDD
ncbi:metallophosphoesterase family protein [Secundilactobacillus mixtipabuli]|uniref:Phosphoesterase n=1 Tax=Secundilactobacillus mixtipabuli TaxID=1435342 RepID=A0A1Z5I9F6_9LACO|nr:DNA repair exonuclease [Secundilactobacillus mixtipabuli]GAW98412.1 phosphoesterase [Secundilactobacillus mixtipabuli]